MTEYRTVVVRGAKTVAEERREKAVLVGVDRPGLRWPVESSLAELERLADTAGADTVGVVTQKLDTLNPRTFVGSGKVCNHIAELCRLDRSRPDHFRRRAYPVPAVQPREIG